MYFSKLLQTDFASRKQKRILGLDSKPVDKADLRNKLPVKGLPMVSVVLPIFNHARFAPGAINSVLSQQIPLELIIVDDGSTDNLEKAISKFLNDKRVRFFKKENGGLASALNLGFEQAVAPYLTWTSADNFYLAGALTELAQTLLEHPSSPLAYANVELIDESGNVIRNPNYRPSDQFEGRLNLTKEGSTLFYYDDNFINSCFLYKRGFANLSGKYSSHLNGVEDYEYWLRLSAFAPAVHTQASKPLYQYRLHPNSMTSNLAGDSLAALTRKVRLAAKEIKDEIENSPIESPLIGHIESSAIKLSPNLSRARDSDFKAIQESFGEPNVGILYRHGETIKIEKQDGVNISVYTIDPVKYLADLGLSGVSVFADHPEEIFGMSTEEYRARSMMFWLSRVDYLLIPTREWSAKELQFKAGLAAAAGIELRVLRKDGLAKREAEYLDLFLPAKHITFYDTLAEAVSDDLKFNLSREYLDKWLYSQSYNGISALVKTGILTKKLEKVFS